MEWESEQMFDCGDGKSLSDPPRKNNLKRKINLDNK